MLSYAREISRVITAEGVADVFLGGYPITRKHPLEHNQLEQPEPPQPPTEPAQAQPQDKVAGADVAGQLHKRQRGPRQAVERAVRRHGHGQPSDRPRRVYD